MTTQAPIDTLLDLAKRDTGVTVREFASARGNKNLTGPYVRTLKKAIRAKLLRQQGFRNGEEVYVTENISGAAVAAPPPAPAAPAKKRGRPKKAEAAAPQAPKAKVEKVSKTTKAKRKPKPVSQGVAVAPKPSRPKKSPTYRRSLIQEKLAERQAAQPVPAKTASSAVVAAMLRSIANAIELG